MLSAVSIVVAIICFLYYFCIHKFSYWRDKKVLGPKPIPFFGNIIESALRKKNIGILYKEFYDQFPNEKVVGIYRMTAPTLVIRDLDVVKNILIKDFDVFSDRGVEFSKEGLGDNLFHCNVDTWQALRKRLTPAFSSGKLKNVFHLIDKHGDLLVDHLKTICLENNEQELHQHTQKFTMGTVMAAAFGLDVNMFDGPPGIIEKAGYHIFRTTYAAETDMLIPNILKKTNLSLYNDVVNRFSYEVARMVLELRNGKLSGTEDLMDIMVSMMGEEIGSLKKNGVDEKVYLKFSEHVMAGQIFILFAAGFGNNALSLSYALFQLAKHSDCQERLIEEIDEVLAKYNGKITYEAIKEMSYLDKVFSEILRMNPLTGAIPRSTKQNYTIPGSEIVIDKGTSVIISPYAIHRDPNLYPDPDTFDPERFSPENSKDRHSCAYIPFGSGPRSCLGQRLAKAQFAVGLVKIFTKFRVEPSEKTLKIENYDPMCTLIATKGGIYVKFIPRKI